MKRSPSQFELALLAMTLDGEHDPLDRVQLAMTVWDRVGETLFPATRPRAAISLDQMIEKLFPDIGDSKKRQTIKKVKAMKLAKYRKFVEWCEWAAWGPDFMRWVPNKKDGGQTEVRVTIDFVRKNAQARVKMQESEGILDPEKIEEEFRYFMTTEEIKRGLVYNERAKKAGTASHAKKVAARGAGEARRNSK